MQVEKWCVKTRVMKDLEGKLLQQNTEYSYSY